MTQASDQTPLPADECIPESPKQEKAGKVNYEVFLNDELRNKKNRHVSNYIRTTKYRWYTFPFVFVFNQLKRYSTLFFLFIFLMSLWKEVSPTTPTASVLSVGAILVVACLREILEDFKRLISDIRANNKKCIVIRNGKEEEIPSRAVRVGDFIKTVRGETFVADILALSCSSHNGVCNIETMSLDGETNIKKRLCVKATLDYSVPEKFNQLTGTVLCQEPNPKLIEFMGSLTFTNTASSETSKVALTIDNLLLRGASLVNTEWVYGLVLYAGSNTKLMKNNKRPRSKPSYLDARLNSFVLFLLCLHQFCCILFTILAVVTQNAFVPKVFYISRLENKRVDAIFVIKYYFTYFILCAFFIPMSMFVAVEVMKTLQLWFMTFDKKMRDSPTRKFYGNSSSLNADLSQIQIIFADKTGTLTQNEMVFKSCAIKGGKEFHDSQEIRSILFNRTAAATAPATEANVQSVNNGDDSKAEAEPLQVADRQYLAELINCIALCHNIIPDTEKETGAIRYDGESPDEIELLMMASKSGVKLVDRHEDKIVLNVGANEDGTGGHLETYEIKVTLAFTSERARCSIVVKKTDEREAEPKYIVYMKGSDRVVKARLKEETEQSDVVLTDTVNKFAIEGLRTLAFAKREITAEFFDSWWKQYHEVTNDIGAKDRLKKIDNVNNILETDLELLGITGIEDRLQDKVPETISYFREAGIQMWMLTGDKVETAENIAASARMIDRLSFTVHKAVQAESFTSCLAQLTNIHQRITSTIPEFALYEGVMKLENKQALIIDGQTLLFIFGETGDSLTKTNLFARFLEDLKNKRAEQIRKWRKLNYRVKNKARYFLSKGSASDSTLSMLTDSTPVEETPTSPSEGTQVVSDPMFTTMDPAEIKRLMAIERQKCFDKFVAICEYCTTVICCRASPMQKSLMVQMVSKKFNKIGLAIGDGLNDVSMIQEARVGVGIQGKEGSQAARTADYAIPSFKHLKRLLAVHGRYSLLGVGGFVQFSFYKNTLITFVHLFLNFFTMYSGLSAVDSTVLSLYNGVFTLLTPFMLGLFNRDVSPKVIEKDPLIYREYRKLHVFDWRSFLSWIFQAFFHATAIFFIFYGMNHQNDLLFSFSGVKSEDYLTMSAALGMIMTTVVDLSAWIAMGHLNILSMIILAFSFLSILVSHLIQAGVRDNPLYFTTYILFTSPKFYMQVSLTLAVCLVPVISIKLLKSLIWPTLWQKQQRKLAEPYAMHLLGTFKPVEGYETVNNAATPV